ncbi:MAG: lysophospholipase [Gemmataceae bacterium]|nr:lysophospholipase [Gemmataceae bacterium]
MPLGLLILGVLPGCLVLRRLPPTTVADGPAHGVVFVADGAGNFKATSKALRDVLERDRLPFHVVTFEWSHGKYRVMADQLDYRHAVAQGKRLAEEVDAYAAQHPHVPIYLMGHSAGSTVVLSALEHLPPGIVERAFLLSPAVSATYDVRPALRNVNRGLHVYFSRHDWWYLGCATHVLGTTDRRYFHPASGRTGFHVAWEPGDFALQPKLIQRPWQRIDAQAGHFGGHFGAYVPGFLKRNVVPLLDGVKS